MSVVIVQHIETSWGKDSRGGANAVKRNSTPEVAKVSVERMTDETLFFCQHLSYHGMRQFPKQFEINPSLPLDVGSVIVNQNEDKILAEFRWTRYGTGAPNREWTRKTLLIGINEWGQIVYNGRFGGWDCNWWYEKHVVNVGWFERVTPSVFTREAPTYRFDAMANLF